MSLFAGEAPTDFGVFMRAFITVFKVASGDPWPESLVLVLEDGEMNWTACAYMCSFILIACWISLEVSVAVLLENFVAASRRMEEEEKLEHISQRKMLSEFKNPMEPLLARLAASFVDDADLSLKLRAVYEARPRPVSPSPSHPDSLPALSIPPPPFPQSPPPSFLCGLPPSRAGRCARPPCHPARLPATGPPSRRRRAGRL